MSVEGMLAATGGDARRNLKRFQRIMVDYPPADNGLTESNFCQAFTVDRVASFNPLTCITPFAASRNVSLSAAVKEANSITFACVSAVYTP